MLIVSWHRGNRQPPKHYIRTRTPRGGDCQCPSRHPLASRTRDSQPSTPLQHSISGMFHAVYPDAAAVGALTPRELDVLRLVAQGLSNPDIAQRLVLSEYTVHRHLANILRKLDLSSRAAAAAWGTRAGLI